MQILEDLRNYDRAQTLEAYHKIEALPTVWNAHFARLLEYDFAGGFGFSVDGVEISDGVLTNIVKEQGQNRYIVYARGFDFPSYDNAVFLLSLTLSEFKENFANCTDYPTR